MLDEQRHKGTIDKLQMSYFLHEGKQNYQKFLKLQKIVAEDPILKFNPEFIHVDRKELMLVHAKKLIRFHELLNFDYFMKLRESMLFSEQMPLSLHFFMFLITLNNLCSDKQEKLFYQPAVKGEILGCYAQTQLAHGSDIQNLMTTATYDESTEEFIVHSPSIEAVKWWIGDLGVYANHAIVFAQLIIKGKNHGLHAFLVPIRDKNHNLLPNVEAGDIGPKYGYQSKDNGYVKFTHHRIKREYMLMRYAKVAKDGTYTRRGNERISYATMLIIRSIIPLVCGFGLSKGVTILTRYSLVRKQFKDTNDKEIKILDYQLQQEKVLPRIAEAYVISLGSNKIKEIANQVFLDAKERNIFTRLNQAHALTSGVKALFTNDTLRGLEILRRAAGGHGFSMYSGMPGLISELGPTPTFQGQNTVLYLQTARYLLKCVRNIQKGKRLPQSVMYLEEINSNEPFVADYDSVENLLNPQNLRKIFLYYSCSRVKKAGQKLMEGISQGMTDKEAWDYYAGIELVECGMSYPIYWSYQNFFEKIYAHTKQEKNRSVLFKLLLLYGLEKIIEKSALMFDSGVITSKTMKNCHIARQQMMSQLRPEALSLVEAYGNDDNSLHSAIGCEDGKAYQRLLEWGIKHNRINKPEIKQEIYTQWKKAKSQMIPKL